LVGLPSFASSTKTVPPPACVPFPPYAHLPLSHPVSVRPLTLVDTIHILVDTIHIYD
jgi:hypothetical protein